ncbi:MAG: hypothetical protein NXI20_05500 [bacterium]|nr:hypothetical protein [bacterium]
MSSSTDYITSQFLNADHSIRVYLCNENHIDLLSNLIKQLERKVSIEIILSDTIGGLITKDVFLLNKIFELRKNGASIFQQNHDEGLDSFTIIDFNRFLIYNPDNDSWTDVADGITETEDWFYNVIQKEKEFYSDSNDIEIQFYSSDRKSIRHQISSIHWSSKNADKVEITGLGEVSKEGQQSIQLVDDTILKLHAYKGDEVKIKAIKIEVFEEVEIGYQLQFLNPSSKKFVTLEEQDENGIYGVAATHRLKLIWEVKGANNTVVEPFNVTGNSGEHEFIPDGSIEITINTESHNTRKKKRLIVQTFPQPILEKYEIPVKAEFQFPEKFEFPNRHQRLSDKFGQYPDKEELKERIAASESKIWDLYGNMEFGKFYQKHSITALNKHVISRIKTYFEAQPQVRDIIDAIKYHHGEGK